MIYSLVPQWVSTMLRRDTGIRVAMRGLCSRQGDTASVHAGGARLAPEACDCGGLDCETLFMRIGC